jgi:NADH:ubiquinone oxidoreductase subunit E/CheY-like chemotaxis protein
MKLRGEVSGLAAKVLVIDDEEGIREGTRRILDIEGYHVETAESGEKGLELARAEPFDLYLLDLKMPGMDGVEVLKELKEIDPTACAVIVTGYASVDSAVATMKLGAFDYVTKPFTPDELLEVVEKALASKVVPEPVPEPVEELPDLGVAAQILARHGYRESSLIAILQDIQKELRYLPREALRYVALSLNLPESRVYSIATFYKAFSLKPRGRHVINVCLGTACHVRGGGKILERLEHDLGIDAGETTYDKRFSLDSVRCVGCCGLAPVVVVDEEFHGKMTQVQLPKVLDKYS